MTRNNQNFIRRRATGFTLAELLIGLAITGVICTAIASMLHSVAYGSESQSDARRSNMAAKLLRTRLDAAIGNAKMVVAAGSNYIVLWNGETNTDGYPDLSELRRIEFNSTTKQLTSYMAPASLLLANDTQYDLDATDFNATTIALKGTTNFPAELWGEGITAFTIELDSGSDQSANTVYYTLTVQGAGSVTVSLSGTKFLRSQ
jgi:type II secretory pathway pseudopilin PulG